MGVWPGLEDEFGDVVAKARAGLGLGARDVARQAGVTVERLAALEGYAPPTDDDVAALAGILGLAPPKLARLAAGTYRPQAPAAAGPGWSIESLVVHQPDDGFASNCHLLQAGDEFAVVDPGAEPDRILDRVAGRPVRWVLVTHGHRDHVGAARAIAAKTGAPVLLGGPDRPLAGAAGRGAEVIGGGARVRLGTGEVEVREVPGHTPGGIAYVLRAPGGPVAAFVGDSLFAGSLGRANASYPALLAAVRAQILDLPPATGLWCGHGPPTTVAQERQANPFFA